MEAVAFPSLTESFKKAIYEVLSPLFDGGAHQLGNKTITFPQVKIVFDPHFIPDAEQVTMAIVGSTVLNQEEQHCTNPDSPTKPGVAVYADIARTVFIGVNNSGPSANYNRLVLDRAWDCLYVALTAQWPEFAQRGILRPTVPVQPVDAVVNAGVIQVSGILHAQLRASYSKFNL